MSTNRLARAQQLKYLESRTNLAMNQSLVRDQSLLANTYQPAAQLSRHLSQLLRLPAPSKLGTPMRTPWNHVLRAMRNSGHFLGCGCDPLKISAIAVQLQCTRSVTKQNLTVRLIFRCSSRACKISWASCCLSGCLISPGMREFGWAWELSSPAASPPSSREFPPVLQKYRDIAERG